MRRLRYLASPHFCDYVKRMFQPNKSDQFCWLNKCEITDSAVLVTVDNVSKMTCDLNNTFSDLKEVAFPSWITQPLLVDLTVETVHNEGELSEMQNGESVENVTQQKRSNGVTFRRG